MLWVVNDFTEHTLTKKPAVPIFIYYIKGAPLSDISQYSGANEVLMPPGSFLEVSNFVPSKGQREVEIRRDARALRSSTRTLR